jgi:hypothetical protein
VNDAKGGAVMRLRRSQRNIVERETAKASALADELRRRESFGPPELLLISEAMVARLRVA